MTSQAIIELHVNELRQLFDAMDPAPFRERDLDPKAERYIVDWAREQHADHPLALVVRVGGDAATPANVSMLQEAVHEHFRRLAISERQRLRQLFRVGRISLAIGLGFVAIAAVAAEFYGTILRYNATSSFVSDSLVIVSWVAMWRPLETFLYDWWPILAEARLLDRLGAMDVRVIGATAQARAG